MAKYFKTKEEFNNWLIENAYPKTAEDMLHGNYPTEDEIISMLIENGYTDLDNLVLDGHAYQIGPYTNNGWLYEDEADASCSKKINRELRKRD